MKNISASYIVAAIALCAAGFFGGMKYEDYQLSKTRAGMVRQFGNNAIGGRGTTNRMGGRQVSGDVVSVDEKSMTVKMPDGSSKIVIFTKTTSFNKAETIQQADITAGEKVAVFGTDNTDGSVTAQNIQINPILRGGPEADAPKP